MSYLPLPLATDTLRTTNTSSGFGSNVNTPSSWIPGFGGFTFNLSGNSTPAGFDIDNNGFIYMGMTANSDNSVQLIQYDENNNQTRTLYCRSSYTYVRALAVGPISQCIYMAVEGTNTSGLIILVPDSLPITTTTNYSTVLNPSLSYTDWNSGTVTNLRGVGAAAIVLDSEERMYIKPTPHNSHTGPIYMYPYTGVPNSSTVFTSRLKFTQTYIGVQHWVYHSRLENSISWAQGDNLAGRSVLYLNTLATFVASISGTTLTVSSILSGIIQFGSSIDIVNGWPTPILIRIISQTSGTPGGAGVYTLSVAPETNVASPIKMMSVVINKQMNSHTTPTSGNSSNTFDGLLNVGVPTDPVASSGFSILAYFGYKSISYDPVSNSLYMNADTYQTTNLRIKRVNLSTRQVTTIAGSINRMNYNTPDMYIYAQPILTEKYPLEYGVTKSGNIIYDTAGITPSGYMPLLIGSQYAYFVTNSSGSTPFEQLVRVKKFRANPSCMSGPLTLSSPAVSIFIVYSNTNTSKNIMPHRPEWNTPVISLSGTNDFCVFTGGIVDNTLTVTAITSGTIQIGATINTPLGGFIVSVAAGGGVGSYTVSITQNIPAGTRISASNGIGRVYTGNETATNGPSLGIDTMLPTNVALYTNNTTGTVYRNSESATVNTSVVAPESVPASGIIAKFIGGISGYTLTVTSVISGVIQEGALLNIPGNPTIVSFASNSFGNSGTYMLDTVLTVPNGTMMTASMSPIIPDIVFFSSSQTNINTRINGGATNTRTGTFGQLNTSSIGLGLQPSNISRIQSLLPNYFFDGTICEVIVYNTDLSTDPFRLQLLEGYLAWKWGAQSKLSSAHMFKTVSPTDYIPFAATPITSASVSRVIDYAFSVSWVGGDNAASYSYSLTPAAPEMIVLDNGLSNKSATISGLVARTAYTLTITANNLLGSKTFNVNVTTKSYVGTLWAGLASGTGNGTSVDTLTGPATNARFYDILTGAFDKFNNMYVCQINFGGGSSISGIRVITPNGIVQSIPLNPSNILPGVNVTPSRSGLMVDSNGTIWLAANYCVYRIVPNQFPFVMNSSNLITTTWTITRVMGTGSPPTTNTQVGLATNVPLAQHTSLFFGNNIPSPYIADARGYLRPVVDNGDGTYNLNIINTYLLISKFSDTGYWWGWNDSVNIYMMSNDNRVVTIYNIKSSSFYDITLPNNGNPFIFHAVVDTFGNFYFALNFGGTGGNIYKLNMLNVDLNNSTVMKSVFMNFFTNINTTEPFIKYNANTSNVTFSPAGRFITTSYIQHLLIDSLNNLYVTYWTHPDWVANYNRPYSIYKFTLT
jgi:hypothetical protein